MTNGRVLVFVRREATEPDPTAGGWRPPVSPFRRAVERPLTLREVLHRRRMLANLQLSSDKAATSNHRHLLADL